jgi:hypothetical protein
MFDVRQAHFKIRQIFFLGYPRETKGYPIYLYFYDPLQVISFNSLDMQACHIISCLFFSIEKYFL